MRKVILFGGTFDPIHQGHIDIALAAKKQLQADNVIFILSRAPRWKKPTVSTEDRLAMLKIAIEGIEGVTYSTFEIDNNSDFDLSIDTARHFVNKAKEEHEDIKFYWLIGSDQVAQLDRWAEIDELSSIVQFVYYSRDIPSDEQANVKRYHLLHIDGAMIDVSSTDVRKMECSDMPPKVFDYICEKGLYFIGRLKSLLSEHRFKHSVSVARLARDIAKANGEDYNKAFFAGLFHDCAKNLDDDAAEKLILEYNPSYIDMPKWSWHQFNGVVLARSAFGVEDVDILEAICFHATGKAHMCALGKIVYSADKIEPLRGYDSSDMINACLKDYRKGFIYVLKENKIYLESKNKLNNNRLTKECFDCYLNRE